MRKTANGTGRHIRLLIRKVLDLFFPRYCPVCDSLLAETEIGVCPRCMVRMPRYIEGMQYGLDRLNGDVYIDALYSLFIFKEDGGVRPMIHALKYGGYSEIGEMLGRMAGRSYPFLSKDYDLIVPVPLHPRKQRKRGYNQALLIAQGLSRVTGIPVQEGIYGQSDRTVLFGTKVSHEREVCPLPEYARGRYPCSFGGRCADYRSYGTGCGRAIGRSLCGQDRCTGGSRHETSLELVSLF